MTCVPDMLSRSASHGQRRLVKSKKSVDQLHNRVPSHLSSLSTMSTISARSAQSEPARRPTNSFEYNPLSLHPTFQPPPRLHERPFIVTDAVEDADSFHAEESILDDYFGIPTIKPTRLVDDMQTPPVETPTPIAEQTQQQDKENRDEDDYFLFKLQQLHNRTAMPRSRWSESTIATVPDAMDPEDDDVEEPDSPTLEREMRHSQWQNFSYKRSTAPRRPPLAQVNSIENYIKRGGWKRRGIVFQQDESTTSSENDLF